MSKNHKNVCTTLNYIKQVLVLGSRITEFVFIYAFAFSVGILIEITSSPFRSKICVITVGIKKYKWIIKKKKKKHDKTVLSAKYILNRIEVLIWFFKSFIDSFISHDEFISNFLKENNEIKEEIKNLKA